MNEPLKNRLDSLTNDVVASYGRDGRTERIGRRFLPSREEIVEVLEEVRQLLFPGYFGRKELTGENIRYHVGSELVRVREKLIEQAYHCLCYGETTAEAPPCRAKAGEIANEFLARMPAIREALALDAQAAYDGDPAAKSIEEVIYCYPGFYAVTVYRIAHELLLLGVPLMPRIMTEHAHSVTGTDIHPGATIGKSFFIDHATGVVIGETAHIGDNVKVYQGVTLGALSFPKDERGRIIREGKRHPTIEDDVVIYAGATILGGATVIGKGSVIGGNTWVTHSLPPGTRVVNNPQEQRIATS